MQFEFFRRLLPSSALLVSCSCLLLSAQAEAQVKAHFATPKTVTAATADSTSPYCPSYSGVLNSISVAVGGTTSLYIELEGTLPYDVSFTLSSGNAAFVVFGIEASGFGPTLTIPAGSLVSATFTIQGVSVGYTYILANSPQLGYIEDPVASWNVTNPTQSSSSVQLIDENNLLASAAPGAFPSCVSPGGNLSMSATILSNCGLPIKGVATDGVSPVLLRTIAGSSGTACYTITTTGPLMYGSISTPDTTTTTVSGLSYGFSQYTPPDGYGDTSDSRTVNIEFDFFLDGGMTNTTTINVATTLVRPPVMLIHGVWSSSGIWNNAFVREGTSWIGSAPKVAWYTTTKADYSKTAAAPFSTNVTLMQGFVIDALKQIRAKQYAAAQVDVIGHSMGGNLTRLYSTLSTYMRPDNLNLGDVHRLITLDTPHFGSNFPNLIVALDSSTSMPPYPDPAFVKKTVSSITNGGDVTGGALCDLAENSTALMGLNGTTNLVGQFITGIGGPPGTPTSPALWWEGVGPTGYKSFESALTHKSFFSGMYDFPQVTINAFRYREQNDTIVPIASQRGLEPRVPANEFPDLHQHLPGVGGGIMDDPNVATQAYVLLDAAAPSTLLLSSMPGVGSTGTGATILPTPGLGATIDAANYAAQCAPGKPLYPAAAPSSLTLTEAAKPKPAFSILPTPIAPLAPLRPVTSPSSVTVTAPSSGATFTAGSTLSITVSVAAGVTVTGGGVFLSTGGLLDATSFSAGTASSPSTFQASSVLDPSSVGPLTITPYIYDGGGKYVEGIPITVVANYTASTLASVNLSNHNLLNLLPGATQALFLLGTYANGQTFDISSSLMGTTWSSSNPAVLAVDANGNVTIVATGLAVVTAKNGGFSDFASFVVESLATPLAPLDYTSQFTIQQSGVRLNRGTGFFVQTITLTNTSSLPLAGPAYLVVSGLPTGVSLIGISGVTGNIAPVGSDYFTLPLAGYSLAVAPGQVVNLQFQFLNPNQVPINYSMKVYRTAIAP